MFTNPINAQIMAIMEVQASKKFVRGIESIIMIVPRPTLDISSGKHNKIEVGLWNSPNSRNMMKIAVIKNWTMYKKAEREMLSAIKMSKKQATK